MSNVKHQTRVFYHCDGDICKHREGNGFVARLSQAVDMSFKYN